MFSLKGQILYISGRFCILCETTGGKRDQELKWFWERKSYFSFRLNVNYNVRFSSVAQSCPTLPDPMNQASLSITNSQSSPKLMCIELVMHPAISSSVVPFSSCSQSLPASGSFPTRQLFASGGQSTRVSALASVVPMNTQDWSPLGWTGWISLQSKGLSRVFPTPRF